MLGFIIANTLWRKNRSASKTSVTLAELCSASVVGFLEFFHAVESEESAPTDAAGFRWKIQNLGPLLQNFDLKKTYGFFADLACEVLTQKYKAYHNFLTGVIGCILVPVDQFFNRNAIPVASVSDAGFEWPKSFGLNRFFATYLKRNPKKEIKFASGAVSVVASCLLFEGIPMANALINLDSQLDTARKSKSLTVKFKDATQSLELKTAQSESLGLIAKHVKQIPAILELLANFKKTLEHDQWKTLSEQDRGRIELFTAVCGRMCLGFVELCADCISKDIGEAFEYVLATVQLECKGKSSEGSSHSLTMLDFVNGILEALQGEKPRERLASPKSYFHLLAEPVADRVYLMCSKIVGYEKFLHQFTEDLKKNKDYAESMVDSKHQTEKALASLGDMISKGGLCKAKHILADLIVTCFAVVNLCFVFVDALDAKSKN